jgi:hypothetical protein
MSHLTAADVSPDRKAPGNAKAGASNHGARPFTAGFPAMTASDSTRRYRIIIRGDCARLLAGIGGHAIESHRGWTCVVASIGSATAAQHRAADEG